MNIHSIETFGTHEGPGIRFVIFAQGCNFKCLYCHNPDSQMMTKNQELSIDELILMIEKNIPYFGENGGVTVSGGEPLLQAKEIAMLFEILRKRKIHTAIDTNGSILTDDVKELLKYTDLVLLDIKHIDPKQHQEITNFQLPPSNQNNAVPSIQFADYLEKNGNKFWVRYVLLPGYTDQPEFLEKTVKTVGQYTNLERIEILPYHTLGIEKYEKLGWGYKLTEVEPPTAEEIERAKAILEKSGKMVLIR